MSAIVEAGKPVDSVDSVVDSVDSVDSVDTVDSVDKLDTPSLTFAGATALPPGT